jgi:ribonuclease HIII
MNSLTLSKIEVQRLKEYIESSHLERKPVTNQYEILRVKDRNVNLILYSTGKLVFNESSKTLDVLNSILEREEGFDYFLGSDETGKGEWYGPLVVVVTALTPEEIIKLRILGVKDSKTMKTPKITETALNIREIGIPYESIVLEPTSYNRLYREFKSEGKSLNDLMAWAHSKIIQKLLGRLEFNQAQVIIDKFDQKKTEKRLGNYDESRVKVIQKTGAETETPVAAASIIAKSLFEKAVHELNEKYDLDLKNSGPEEINPEILPYVAKAHFKNVKSLLGVEVV